MFKKLIIFNIMLLGMVPLNIQAKDYQFKLPPTLQINNINEWMLSNVILDQVCTPFASLCVSALDNLNAVTFVTMPYAIKTVDQKVWVTQEINIIAIDLPTLSKIEINVDIFKYQYFDMENIQDQKMLIKSYSI